MTLSSLASALLARLRRASDDGASGMTDTGEPAGSTVDSLCISATFPSSGSPLTVSQRSLGGGSSVAGTKLSVRSPFGVWPPVLCAKSLRRSGEVAL